MSIHLLVSLALLTAPHSTAYRTTVMTVQGRGHTSALAGDTVVVTGLTTVVTRYGFYIQDPAGDADPATSDALFAYTGSAPTVAPGDQVELVGVVNEYRPGNHPYNLTITELDEPSVTVLSGGHPLPAPVRLGTGGRLPPTRVIEDDAFSEFEPATDGIDFYESLEGMRVLVPDAVAAGVTGRYGEVWVLPDAGASATGVHDRGGVTVSPGDFNPERIQLDDTLLPDPFPVVRTGDRIGDVTGVVSYRYGNFEVLPSSLPPSRAALHPRESSALRAGRDHLLVAAFNAHNLDGRDAAKVVALAEVLVKRLGSPDVVVLGEVQDDSGPASDGTVTADRAWSAVVAGVREAGGPVYDFRDIAPEDNRDGGAPGANIRVGLLFRPDRVAFVDRGAALPTSATGVIDTGDGAALTLSPGRIAPGKPAWKNARKPLAAELTFAGRRFFIVACHFTSRLGSSPLFGVVQPPTVGGAEKRRAQARAVRDFVDALLGVDTDARVVVAGDFNAFQFSESMAALTGPLVNLTNRLPAADRYTYSFEGNSQALDHILVSRSLAARAGYDVVHACVDYAGSVSDHDPVLARLWFGPAATATIARLTAFPNPFSTSTTLRLEDVGAGAVDAALFDVAGRRVRTLRLARDARGGARGIWDGYDDRGRAVASGVYLVKADDVVVKLVRVK